VEATPTTPATTAQPRKQRGQAIEQTSFMRALASDPVATMQALVDETVAEWESSSRTEFKPLLRAANA